MVVIPASSGDGPAREPIYLRPIAGRPQLGHVLDAVGVAASDGLIVFAHGADEKTARDVQALTADRGSVVTGTGDPAVFIDEMLKRLRGRPGDILFVSATAAPLDGAFLSEYLDDYRGHPDSACRVQTATPGGEARTLLMVAPASLVDGIGAVPGDSGGTFADRVFRLLEKASRSGRVRDFVTRRPHPPGDVSRPRDYAAAARAVRAALVERLMDAGVTIIDPERTYVDWGVTAAPGTTLYPDTYLEGATTLGAGCIIEPNVKITDSSLGDNVVVKMCSVITESAVGAGAQIGPFAHLRPKTRLGRDVKVGNFVEVKKSTIGDGSKASHLSYIGDAQIGTRVNVGAGTITCNYDGVNKHATVIGDGVFIGSDTQFIAPVTVGDYSLIGAGSTISKDVPPDALAVGRARQVNLPGRGVKSRKKHEK